MAASPSVRTWRTAFLTLRDEALTSPLRTSLLHLLQNLIFSHSDSLILATSDLPPHEATSDIIFLMELAATTSEGAEDRTQSFTHICHLVHEVSRRVSLEINSSAWTLMLDYFGNMVKFFIGIPATKKRVFSGDSAGIRSIVDCLETLRCLISVYHRKCLLSENIQLVKFLLHVVECSHSELLFTSNSSGNQRYTSETGKRIPRYNSLWEVQTITLDLIGDEFARVGSSLPADIWQSTIKVLRKVMDVLASKSLLLQDNVMSRFYTSVLNCLHLVLMDPKGSISDHVAGLVAALRMFFSYGLTSKPPHEPPVVGNKNKALNSISHKTSLPESSKNGSSPYRPPHLRKRVGLNMQQSKASDSLTFSDHESSMVNFSSSDSDYSDSDGSVKDVDSIRCSKARVASILCIQDLCQADPKSFTAQWTMLLPTNEVLHPRKREATLMTCLLFDPFLKARIASASTLAAMMDGPASVFLQVAEHKESTKCGSFTPLSNSLGQILMQLHTGILYLIQRETHSGFQAALFKILMLLISSTPYSRMPPELLPTVITSLRAKIEEGFPFKKDQTGLLAVAFSCLTTALSTSPSLPQVKEMFLEELSTGFVEVQGKRGVLSTIFLYSEHVGSPTISFEALQALRAVSHNYPSIMVVCWERISTTMYGFLKLVTAEVSTRSWKGNDGNSMGLLGEKIITAAIKVLDECLRAISGFKGTEDPLDDKLLDTPFTSDCIRIKKVSSAPSYEPESSESTEDKPKTCLLGSEQWCETIERHMPLILRHTSAMVRAASLTCFAGITSSVFFNLTKEKQNFILSSLIHAAENDEVPSVRSAACRAIGVIACFPQISQSAEILNKFIHAAELNTRNPLVSVRITSSWALANICDSLRSCINDDPSERCYIDSYENSQLLPLLIECALRLTKEGDKIKSNAVRALGNISRFVRCRSSSGVPEKPVGCVGLSLRMNSSAVLPFNSDRGASQNFVSYLSVSLGDSGWLGRMVQAFLSCVTTGNVKVQWNVCHALSNLFQNETLRLQDMDWAPSVFSVLLLLLRDSSNFKIRIQAAAALAVPTSICDYGRSFSDVVQGLVHIIECLGSDQISAPSSFKYRLALEKQLTSTMLHVLSLCSSTDHQPLRDFFVKKASFLEEWFKALCSSLEDTCTQPEANISSINKQKKEMVAKAIRSLIKVYEGKNHHAIGKRFEKLVDSHYL